MSRGRGANHHLFGKKRSAEERHNISVGHLGQIAWNKGKEFLQIKGEKNYRWKGGYENHLWHNARRRMQKLGIPGFHSQEEWQALKEKYNFTCPSCKRQEPAIRLTRDHIIPVSRSGSDNIDNIQPLCLPCNVKKYNKTIKFAWQ